MSENEIEINLNLEYLRLTNLAVEENTDSVITTRKNKVELIKFDNQGNLIELKYVDEFVGKVKINLELTAMMRIEGDISETFVKDLIASENADDLAFPLLTEASHIISFITSKTGVMPVILPPTLKNFNHEI